MKKIIALCLIFTLVLSMLAGCKKTGGDETTDPSLQETAGSTGATENSEQTTGTTGNTEATETVATTEMPTDPAPTQSATQPSQAATQPTQPSQAATQPTQPSQMATQPTQPSAGPTQPATQPTQPPEDPRVVTQDAKLKDLVIVSNSKNWVAAQSLAQKLKQAFGVTLPVKSAAGFHEKGAIYVGTQDYNTYGGCRYSVVTDESAVSIYLNGSDECLDAAEDYLLANINAQGGYPYGLKQEYIGYRYDRSAGGNRYEGFDIAQPSVQKTSLGSGVTKHTLTYTYNGKSLRAYAVVVSAGSSAKLKVVAAPWDESNSASNPVNLYTVADYRQQLTDQGNNVLAICNGGFFKMSEGSNLPFGAQIVDGKVLQAPSTANSSYSNNWFGVTTDGKYVISDTSGYESSYQGKIQYAVGGGAILMQNGKPTFPAMENSAYLTCVGITQNGDLILLCMQTAPSYAIAIRAFMDLELDVTTILNLDGGGSTTLYTTGRGTLGYDICGDGLVPRKVADAIAIVVG